MDIWELANFQPKQMEAAALVFKHPFTLYGGAAGGGKSYFLRWMGVALAIYYTLQHNIKGGRIGIFCEDYPSLKDRQLSKIPYEFPQQLGKLNLSDHEYRMDPKYGGWTLAFRNLDDPSKYLSAEFAAILIDELTRNPRETFDFLNMRRRWPGIKDTKFIGTTNPGGIGHAWVKKLWIDKDFRGEAYNPQEFGFISAKAIDNKYLGPEYDRQLQSLPEKLRKAYRDGDWDIFAGQYFTEWTKEKNTCLPFEIPKGWLKLRSIDYGYQAPSSVHWYAADYDGKIYAYRELYTTGLTYAQLAEKIKILTPPNENIDYTVADTSMFAKTYDTGEDGDKIFADKGVPLTPANKERLLGWNLMREYIRTGKLVYFSTCINAIRTIPALVHSELTSKLEDLEGEDHCADEARYLLMSLPQTPVRESPEQNPYLLDPDSPWKMPEPQDFYNYK